MANWVIINKKTGNVAYTRESGYHKKAEFKTREAARNALKAGRVLANSKQGTVRHASEIATTQRLDSFFNYLDVR